jgi:hypothetical protein
VPWERVDVPRALHVFVGGDNRRRQPVPRPRGSAFAREQRPPAWLWFTTEQSKHRARPRPNLSYEPLPIVDKAVDDLRLDLENYRIPARPEDETAALQYLFASEDVLEAARLILRDGYFDNEVPIVVEEPGSGYVVLEGNRRVSALKALRDPTLVPGHESEVRKLLNRYEIEAGNLPSVIRVLVVPNRSSARPRIARLHTGLSKKAWSRDQQANFYLSLIGDDMTVEDLKREYPGVEIWRFIRMAAVRRLLIAAPYVDRSLHDYARSDELRMSAFEYAYRNKEIAETIGIAFSRDGFLEPEGKAPEEIAASLAPRQVAALEFLLTEFRAGRLNTRSPAFKKASADHELLLEKLRSVAPSTSVAAGGSATQDAAAQTPEVEGSGKGSGPDAEASRSGRRGANHPNTKSRLDLTAVPYENAPVNLKVRYYEVLRINIVDFPVAASLLLRSVFELTIKWHLGNKGQSTAGELTAVFRRVRDIYVSEKAFRGTLNAINSGTAQKPGSLQWFNVVAHDSSVAVGAADVRQAWELVNPLVRLLLS